MQTTHTFEATSFAALETSLTPALFNQQDNVLFDCSIFLEDGIPTGFEVDGGDGEYYASGMLETEGNNITGYDGIFALPWFICDELVKLGFNVDEVK